MNSGGDGDEQNKIDCTFLTACTAVHVYSAIRPSSRRSTSPDHGGRVQDEDVVQEDGFTEISKSTKEDKFGAIVHGNTTVATARGPVVVGWAHTFCSGSKV